MAHHKKKPKERDYGRGVHEDWSPEQRAEHRELQALRAAGVLSTSRRISGGRTRRNPKKVNLTPDQLQDWVTTRFNLLDESAAAHPDLYEYGLLG